MHRHPHTPHASHKANRRIAFVLLAVMAGVIGLTFAAVPLYAMFCRVTGYNGTVREAEAPSARVLDRMITVRFDANVSSDLGWSFQPVQRQVHVNIGENKLVFFEAKNLTNKALTGSASFSVTPDDAAPYFAKIQCFCITDQTLQPGQTAKLPVSFFVDPAIMDDPNAKRIQEIVLSYTYFKANKPDGAAKARATTGAASKPFETAGSPG